MNAPKMPAPSRIDLSESDRDIVEHIRGDLTERMSAGFDTAPLAMARYIGRLEAHLIVTLRILDDAEVRP